MDRLHLNALGEASEVLSAADVVIALASSAVMRNDETHSLGEASLPKGYASMCARMMFGNPTFGHALTATSKFMAASHGVFELNLNTNEGVVRLSLAAKGRDTAGTAALEAVWISMLTMMANRYLCEHLPVNKLGVRAANRTQSRLEKSLEPQDVVREDTTFVEFPEAYLLKRGKSWHTETPLIDSVLFTFGSGASLQEEETVAGEAIRSLDLYESDTIPAQLSARQKRRLIGKHFGENFRSMELKRRVDHALKLIAQPHLTMSDIAERTGYSDDRSFRRFIKMQTGHTPSAIREQMSEEIDLQQTDFRTRLTDIMRHLEI
ncbi:MAG: helix-turn-helix domain-containing protein [Henriciella sp.]|uniref:helix-turn-helix domain-containing protein n=1 Tax=Henriciella sp. TaxID=1968823 RepID=UPI003C72BF5B